MEKKMKKKTEKKMKYEPPVVKISRVVLEEGIANIAQCSPIRPEGILVNEWVDAAPDWQAAGDGDVLLNF